MKLSLRMSDREPIIMFLSLMILLIILLASCTKITQTFTVNGSEVNSIVREYDYIGLESYGQSLSVGGSGGKQTAVILESVNAVMFNTGVRAMDWGRNDIPTSFIQLSESVNNAGTMGETPCSGAADMFCKLMPQKSFQIFASASGQSNQSIDSLFSGRYYDRLISNVHYAENIATSESKTYSLGAVFWTQGEADYSLNTRREYYRNKLDSLQVKISADVGYNVPIIISQIASQNKHDINTPSIALAQLDLAINSPNFTMSAPQYIYDYLEDNTHMNAENYRKMGERDGYAAKKLLIDGVKNFVYPLSATKAGNTIIITFNVPAMPLAFDTTLVTNPGNFGFNVRNASNVILPINSIIIVGNTVRIKCGGTPATVSYAINGEYKKSGRTSGARGCLRDSDTILNNYCAIFKMSL